MEPNDKGFMAGLSFPSAPDLVTPEWLTSVLRDAGAIGSASVRSLSTERVGEGVGFVGQLARFTLEYDRASPGAPRTLIGKFPVADEAIRQIAATYGLYRCEVNFYREIAGIISMRTPRCYFSAMNDSATEFVLLLEDLSETGRVGDQVIGCTLNEARLALGELATFHASWWQHEALDRMSWLPRLTDLGRTSATEAYPQNWESCLERFGHMLSPEIHRAAPSLGEKLAALMDRFEQAPHTIVHADYRLDNLFFGNPGSDYELAVIDWQITCRGVVAFDVANFVGLNLETEVRRQNEDALLEHYHRVLVKQGVGDYSLESLKDDYVLSLLAHLCSEIGHIATFDPANERGEQLLALILGRSATAVMDLRALDALP